MIVTNSVSDHEIVDQNEKLQGALSKSSEVQNPADSQSQSTSTAEIWWERRLKESLSDLLESQPSNYVGFTMAES